jgi:hypothetical protein
VIHAYDDGTFAIASRGCWLPGVYADERAARYAFRFGDDVLALLRDRCAGPIAFEDLQAMRGGREAA